MEGNATPNVIPKATPSPEDLFTGTAYRTISRIGAGGMGEVFLVEHRELGRDVVAKVLHAELASDPRTVDRMRVERESLGRLNHPHIVSVVDSASLKDGRPFFVMERLHGQTLAAEIKGRSKLPVYEAVQYACQLLSALSAAHAIGIVHRDVKPENLFICTLKDGSRILKVLDFGVARVLPDAPAAAPLPLMVPTDVGVLMGTPRYASPEAAVGCRVDTRADLYGAALVLYLMLAGRGPFDHHSRPASVLAAHVRDEPAPPSKLAGEPVPFPLDQAVLRGLRKDPRERFSSALEFRTELEAAVALLRKPIGWVETTLFPPEKPSAPDTATPPPPSTEVTNSSEISLSGTTERLPPNEVGGSGQSLPNPTAAREHDLAPTRVAQFLLPFVLGMVVAGFIAVLVTTVVGR
ncbi:MAG TPA: serine/threonine-protein kinase [Polyangiaceae bacterium]|nr:serine/threonine-protein kinase [Polyangiaceae bacterium]